MRILQVLLVLVWLCPLPLIAQDEGLRFRRAFERIEEFAARNMEHSRTPGLALAVTNRERLLHLTTRGFARMGARTPVTPETLFGIGSIGKSFTAVAILQLRDQNKLDPQAPVSEYLPWFKVHSTTPISAHHLLTHTAGLPGMRMELMSSLYQAFWLTEAPWQFEPGKQYHYSSSAFDVLSILIEAVSGRSYGEYLRQAVLDPLGMTRSEPLFKNEIRLRLATSYEPLYDDRPAHSSHPLVESNWYEYGGGAGSVCATATDLAAYLRMLLNGGVGPDGQRILSEESFRLLTQRAVKRGDNRYYGYALEVTEEEGRTVISHGGGVQGFRSMLVGDLEDGLGVVLLANGPLNRDLARFALQAARAALHHQELPSPPALDPPTRVTNAADYAGTYTSPTEKKFRLRADGDTLLMLYKDRAVPLEKRGEDRFLSSDPDFSLFLLRLVRERGSVVEALHGSDWFTNQRYHGPRQFQYPSEWDAYPGHYRTATRHHMNFRIVLRKGTLWLVHAGGEESPLVPIQSGRFRVADSPEWVSFDTILNGRALHVNFSGTNFHRDFTP